MALRDQPYLPLYIQDFLTDEKLIECSAEATGVYIRLMCILHKQKEYGVLLLKQSLKQGVFTCSDFACMLDRSMPYKEKIIDCALKELLLHDVIQVEGSKLLQKRMIKDNDISLKRAHAGSKGGKNTQLAKANVKANTQANPEDESEYEIDYESIVTIISELPDIDLANKIINTMIHGTIKSFILEFPDVELHKTEQWREYINRLKKSDWIMGETTGKNARLHPITLDFVCREKTLLKAFSDGWINIVAKKDGSEWL